MQWCPPVQVSPPCFSKVSEMGDLHSWDIHKVSTRSELQSQYSFLEIITFHC